MSSSKIYFVITFVLLISCSLSGQQNSEKCKNFLDLSFDSIYYLLLKDSAFVAASVSDCPKDTLMKILKYLANDVYNDFWGGYTQFKTASTTVFICNILEHSKDLVGRDRKGIYFIRGMCLYFCHKYLLSIRDLTKLIKLEPDSELGLMFRGLSKRNIEDYYGAIEDLSLAVDKSSKKDNISVQMNSLLAKGECQEKINQIMPAIITYSDAIKTDPEHCKAYLERGRLYVSSNFKELGCLDLSKAGEQGCDFAYDLIREFCKK